MQSYVRHADTSELDASLLLGVLFRYAIGRDLSHGPFVYRYSGEDGLAGKRARS
jgi:hypothetical protein